MGNLSGLDWPTPWYQDLYEFLTNAYVLPFTATFVVLILMLTVSFISSRPTR